MVYYFCSLSIAFISALLIIQIFWVNLRPRTINVLIKACLAIGLGFGISSILFFLWLLIPIFKGNFNWFIGLELGFLLCLSVISVSSSGRMKAISSAAPLQTASNKKLLLILAIFFYGALASTLISFTLLWLKDPHGSLDALINWNLRARFLFRGTEHWRDAFSPLISWSRPDYPILIAGSVARLWKYVGQDLTVIPASISLLFLLATVGLLLGSLSILRSKGQGYLGGIVLLGTQHYILCAANQVADVPLGFFILATFVLFYFYDTKINQNISTLFLAGLFASCAAWTKHEGMLFITVLIIGRFLIIVPTDGLKEFFRQIMAFALGALPIGLTVAFFKIKIAAALDIITAQTMDSVPHKIMNVGRYFYIVKNMLIRIGKYGLFIIITLYFLLCGMDKKTAYRKTAYMIFIIILLMLLFYSFYFLIQPYSVRGHIQHSLGRLCLQLWPSLIFAILLLTPIPEEIIKSEANS
jgi:hypothetical protein